MSSVLGLVLALASVASADAPLQAYAPLKLVGLMPDTGQALLWDEAIHEYRLAKVGDVVEGWRLTEVAAIERRATVTQGDIQDELALTRLPRPGAVVMMSRDDGKKSSALAPPATPPAPAPAPPPAPAPVPVPVAAAVPAPAPEPEAEAEAVPIDPYAPAAAPAPLDPYAAQAAPVTLGDPAQEARTVARRDSGAVAPPQPTVIDAAPEPPATASVEKHALRRAELDREITDFDRLLATVKVAPAQGGGFAVVRLDARSWLASLGMRQGDIVRSVAGEQVSNVEDAARVYARIRQLPSFLVEIDRGGQRVVLSIAVR